MLRVTVLVALAVAGVVGCRASRSADVAPHATVIVRLSKVGLEGGGLAGDSLANPVLVFSTGHSRVALGTADLAPLTDTLRLYRLPAITADVTDGDVHLELTGAGRLQVGGDVSGGPATRLSGTGRHIILLRGGVGAETAR